MTVYADMLFTVNFAANYVVLRVVARLMPGSTGRWRQALAAAIMAAFYTLVVAVPILRNVNIFAAQALILMAGVAVGMRPDGWRRFLRLCAAGYAVSFVLGGLGMALFHMTNLPYAAYVFVAENALQAISLQVALFAAVIAYLGIKVGLRVWENRAIKRQTVCTVKVRIADISCEFDALVDTGHTLKEPVSGSPVIVAQHSEIAIFTQLPCFAPRVRVVPFTSLGQTEGLLTAFRADAVTINSSPAPACYIGISNQQLCKSGRFRGLVGGALLA
jgi:stage II sporulation protein GA (sporulation sigma-E factor processing peptidase)